MTKVPSVHYEKVIAALSHILKQAEISVEEFIELL